MDNLALVTEITRNIPGVFIGRINEGTRYELTLDYEGEGTLRFWIVDEFNASKKITINRIPDMTTGAYRYTFTSPCDGIITYHIKNGKANNIMLIKK